MKLYISGPMSDLPEHNFPAFRKAAEQLTAAGYDVIDPSENFGGRTDLERKQYMREDISNVLRADGLALLDGWSMSKGAGLEVAIADELGLEAQFVESWVSESYVRLPSWAPGRVLNKDGVYTEYGDAYYTNPDTQHGDGPIKAGGTVQYAGSLPPLLKADEVLRIVLDRSTGQATISAETLTKEQVDAEKRAGETILEEAQRLVHGDRGHNYGHPIDDFNRTAGMWTAMWRHKLKDEESFGPREVALGMIAVKMSRETNRPKRDNRTDICGYAETLDMVDQRLAES